MNGTIWLIHQGNGTVNSKNTTLFWETFVLYQSIYFWTEQHVVKHENLIHRPLCSDSIIHLLISISTPQSAYSWLFPSLIFILHEESWTQVYWIVCRVYRNNFDPLLLPPPIDWSVQSHPWIQNHNTAQSIAVYLKLYPISHWQLSLHIRNHNPSLVIEGCSFYVNWFLILLREWLW